MSQVNKRQPSNVSCQRSGVRCRSGFSLLELLIYIAILAVMMTVVVGIFISLNKGRGASEARGEVNSNIRFAVEKISQDLRSATSSAAITSPNSTSTPTGILTIIIGSDTISYATTTDNKLQRSKNGVPETVTSDAVKINSLSFKRLENINPIFGTSTAFVSVEVNVSAGYRSESPDWQYEESKKATVGIRN